METLRNPETGTVREFDERRARVKRRQGWQPVEPTVDAPEPDPEPEPAE